MYLCISSSVGFILVVRGFRVSGLSTQQGCPKYGTFFAAAQIYIQDAANSGKHTETLRDLG